MLGTGGCCAAMRGGANAAIVIAAVTRNAPKARIFTRTCLLPESLRAEALQIDAVDLKRRSFDAFEFCNRLIERRLCLQFQSTRLSELHLTLKHQERRGGTIMELTHFA